MLSNRVSRYCFDILLLGIPFLVVWCQFQSLEGFPSNDDPFYGRPVQILAEESRFQLIRQQGELTASSVAHILVGAAVCSLTGFAYRNLYLAVILQMWLGTAAVYGCAAISGSSRRWTFLLAATYCWTPLCFGHAFTFMIDGPAMAWLAVALFCFLYGFHRSSLGWFLAGSAAAGWAFWMRQTHVVAILFPLVAIASMRYRRAPRAPGWTGTAAILSVAALSVLLFESGCIVPNDLGRVDDALPREYGLVRLRQIAIALYGQGLTLGLALLPVAPVMWSRIFAEQSESSRRLYRRCHFLAAAVGGLMFAVFAATQGRACLTSATGPFIQNAHFGPIFLSDMDEPGRWGDMGGVTWPVWVWQILTLLAIANVTQFAWWTSWSVLQWKSTKGQNQNGDRRIDYSLGLFAILPAITIVTLALIEGPVHRYWMPAIPTILIWLGIIGGKQAKVEQRSVIFGPSLGTVLALLVMSVVFLHDYLTWNQARYRQVEAWLQAGMRPQDFDGGRDINAWLRSAEDSETRSRPGDDSPWWSGHATVSLAVGPRPGWREVARLPWNSWATGQEHAILVLDKIETTPMAQMKTRSLLNSSTASIRAN